MDDDPIEIPIDGVLDLHTFSPKEAADVVEEYLAECARRGIVEVRVIHGKGTGQLRERIHSLLRRLQESGDVTSFALQPDNWGATVVHLRSG